MIMILWEIKKYQYLAVTKPDALLAKFLLKHEF